MADENPFEDFAAGMDEETSVLEQEETNKIQAAVGEEKKPAAKREPDPKVPEDEDPFQAASRESGTPNADEEWGEDDSENMVDSEYEELMDFPDFSKPEEGEEESDEEEDEDPEEDDGSEEGESEDHDEEEDEESDDDDEEEDEGFDLDRELKKIEKLKINNLRKAHLTNKAKLRQAEIDRDRFKKQAEDLENDLENVRSETLDEIATPKAPPLSEYEPYQKVVTRYNEWKTRAMRRIHDGRLREQLAQDEGALRGEAARLQVLTGVEYDKALERFEGKLKEKYGANASKVLDLSLEAAEFELEAHEVAEEFKSTSETQAVEYATREFENRTENVTKEVLRAFTLSDEEMSKNPFSFNAYMTRRLNDTKDGKKSLKLLQKDLSYIQKMLLGPVPPDLSQYATPAEKEEAKRLFAEEHKKLRTQRERLAPQLMAIGVEATRHFPILIKRLNELEKLVGKRGKAPTLKGGSNPAPRKKKQTDEELERELNAAINNIG